MPRTSAIVFLLIGLSVCNGLPGGDHEIPIDDPDVEILQRFVKEELMKTTNSVGGKELGTILKASRQVVSGTITTLTFKTNDGNCSTSIWEQKWLQKRQITKSSCGHEIQKRSLTNSDDMLGQFHNFMTTYNKEYKNNVEYKKRYKAFKANLKKIQMMNDNEQGTAKYGVNEFADLTEKEFKMYLGLRKPESPPVLPTAAIPDINIPDEYDWRNFNAVTPVKNQGSCGSCWTFSVTGNIEGQWAINRGQLISLSEQEIVDCDSADDGCGGGYMTTAYNSIVGMGGLESEKDYPYEGKDDSCRIDASEIEVTISGGVNISTDEADMAKWLVANGPISIGLNANAMQFYMGGVSHPFKVLCNPSQLDHGVLIVGYGVHTSTVLKRTLPYWIVKNSWGRRWGELGYYRVYRGDGTCGVNLMASSAVL